MGATEAFRKTGKGEGAGLGSRVRGKSVPAMPGTTRDDTDSETCPLCGRPLGTANIDRHHLIPRTFKGKEQFPIHKICHRKIHATFSERELLRAYHTWDALRSDADIRAFIEWVGKKPPEFYTRTFTANKKKNR